MGTYAYLNGIIRCETEVDTDIVGLFGDLALQNEHWHRNDDQGYLFSFDVKESRLEDLWSVFDQLRRAKTKDSVLGEWYDLEADILVRFDSDEARIDVIELSHGKLTHRRDVARPGREAGGRPGAGRSDGPR